MDTVKNKATEERVIELMVLLRHRFSMADLMNITEWLESANKVTDTVHWRWYLCSEQGQVVLADNGLVLSALRDPEHLQLPDQLVILQVQDQSLQSCSFSSLLSRCYSEGRPVINCYSDPQTSTPSLTEQMATMILPLLSSRQAELLHQRMYSSEKQPLGIADNRIHRALQLMRNNLEQPLNKQELAAGSYLSVRQLERLFRRYFDDTPSRYYTHLRLNSARRMLLDSNLKVADIALACGFGSVSHFCKIYQQNFGITPGQEIQR